MTEVLFNEAVKQFNASDEKTITSGIKSFLELKESSDDKIKALSMYMLCIAFYQGKGIILKDPISNIEYGKEVLKLLENIELMDSIKNFIFGHVLSMMYQSYTDISQCVPNAITCLQKASVFCLKSATELALFYLCGSLIYEVEQNIPLAYTMLVQIANQETDEEAQVIARQLLLSEFIEKKRLRQLDSTILTKEWIQFLFDYMKEDIYETLTIGQHQL